MEWTWNGRLVLTIVLLPLFGQTFHYMKDLRPLWALSKAFPVLSLPLALPVLTCRNVPLVFTWLAAFLWLVLVSSVIAMFTFDQNVLLGLTAQVKLLPMLYAFSFLGFLLLVRPTIDELMIAFLACAALTFLALILLWAFAPQSWYATGYKIGDAPLLSVDDRGNRIRMPMYFAMIATFTLLRAVLARPDWRTGLALAVALAVIVGIVRTRATIIATAVTAALICFMAAPPRWRLAAVLGAAVAGVALLQIPFVASAFDTSSASGFDVRRITMEKAAGFLGTSPWRWTFGVGTITSLQPDGLAKFFNHFFFLADIAWLGIVFEFGIVGAALMVWLMASTAGFGHRLRQRLDRPVLAGLQDYVLFTIVISPLYSTMTLQPGEIAVIAASFVYIWIILREASA